MLKIITDQKYSQADQYAQHIYLEKYVPNDVNVLWIANPQGLPTADNVI